YITIDQKLVAAGKTGRRAGAHSDAYIENNSTGEQIDITRENTKYIAKETGQVSHTYIIYDMFPTEFYNAKFPLIDSTCDSSLSTFNDIAKTAPIITYPNYTLLKLDPYVVHAASTASHTARRTFVKISISRKQYARGGNTINP